MVNSRGGSVVTAQPKGWTSAHDTKILGSGDAKAKAELEAAHEAISRALTVYDRCAQTLRDGMAGSPGAQSYDGIGRAGGNRVHCWNHQQDHTQCERDGLDGCNPETITTHDPVGEAALIPDRCAHQQQEIHRSAHRLVSEARKLTDLIADAVPQKRAPTDKDRREAAMDNRPGCQSCARIPNPRNTGPQWEEVERPKSKCGGNLPEPMDLCGPCYRRVNKTGSLPSRADVAYFHTHRSWPPQHEPASTAPTITR
jgi:hypothetical protein